MLYIHHFEGSFFFGPRVQKLIPTKSKCVLTNVTQSIQRGSVENVKGGGDIKFQVCSYKIKM